MIPKIYNTDQISISTFRGLLKYPPVTLTPKVLLGAPLLLSKQPGLVSLHY